MDLETGGLLPDGHRPDRAGRRSCRDRYEALWDEVTREEVFSPDEQRHRIAERLRRLSELGFAVDEVELISSDGGRRQAPGQDPRRRARPAPPRVLPAHRAGGRGEAGPAACSTTCAASAPGSSSGRPVGCRRPSPGTAGSARSTSRSSTRSRPTSPAGWRRPRSSTRSSNTAGSCPRRPAATWGRRQPPRSYFAHGAAADAEGSDDSLSHGRVGCTSRSDETDVMPTRRSDVAPGNTAQGPWFSPDPVPPEFAACGSSSARPPTEAAGLLALPWDQPLEEWADEHLLEVPQRGISRHVVRFATVRRLGLRAQGDRRAPGPARVRAADRVRGRGAADRLGPRASASTGRTTCRRSSSPATSSTRCPTATCSPAPRADHSAEQLDRHDGRAAGAAAPRRASSGATAPCRTRCSAPTPASIAAYLVDAETVERHASLSPGQRSYDVELAMERVAAELMDLESGGPPARGDRPDRDGRRPPASGTRRCGTRSPARRCSAQTSSATGSPTGSSASTSSGSPSTRSSSSPARTAA